MQFYANQVTVVIPGKRQGCYLITQDILAKASDIISKVDVGTCNLFIQHTSASISVNENADPDVRSDLRHIYQALVPFREEYNHKFEGEDDMPAHALASIVGPSVTIPIRRGKLMFGTWQGIYLNEHRDFGGDRKIVVTVMGSASK